MTRVAVLLAGAGGTIGTALRFAVGELLPTSAAATLTVNLSGAFLLGVLLGWAHPPALHPPALRPRSAPANAGALQPGGDPRRVGGVAAFFGTGLLGGFTTYSALALEIVELPGWRGIGYGLLTLTGVAFAVGGIVLGRRGRRS